MLTKASPSIITPSNIIDIVHKLQKLKKNLDLNIQGKLLAILDNS